MIGLKYLMVAVFVVNIIVAADNHDGHAIYGWSAALTLGMLWPTGKGGTHAT